MKKTARAFDLETYFKVRHRVVRAIWREAEAKWLITVRKDEDPTTDFVDYCDFFLKYVVLRSQSQDRWTMMI
jgi:cation diffusion facilitator CzcD-associated flavoprotein CzcO